jgi:hypothetical protein
MGCPFREGGKDTRDTCCLQQSAGLPMDGMPSLSFMDATSLIRLYNHGWTWCRGKPAVGSPQVRWARPRTCCAFYRISQGTRPPQFLADQGGLFTGTIRHEIDGGSLLVLTAAR